MNDLEKLENLIIDILKCSKSDLKDEHGPSEISNWDSITHMELISKIEEGFNIHLDVDEMNQIDTIGSMKGVLRKQGLKL